MGSWRKVIAQFENDLNQEEKVVFKYATLQGLLKDVAVLEETQRKSSKLRQLSVKIQPLLDAIEDYGKALDVLANASSDTAPQQQALIQDGQVAQRHNDYFLKLVDMLERIGDVLPRYSTYAKCFQFHTPLQQALQAAHLQIMVFFSRTKNTLSKSGLQMLLKTTWRSFDKEFEECISRMRRYRDLVEDEARLASTILQVKESELAQVERKRAAESRKKVERLELVISEQSKEGARRWLNARKCLEERNLFEEHRLDGSCEWILQREEVGKWRNDSATQIFWLHGAPGCGKSYLYSKLLNCIEEETPLTYFLFCGGDKERVTFTSLLRSWTLQLLELFPQTFNYLETVRSVNKNPVATHSEVTELLELLLDEIPSCYLTVDALDECSDGDQFFKRIAFIPKRFKILVTSRTPFNIRKDTAKTQRPLQTLEILPELSQGDIDHFIQSAVDNASFSCDVETLIKIRERLSRCDGMFLWVKLMMDHLESQTCEYDMLRCLEELPEGLPQTYESILGRINLLPASQRLLAHKVFLWGVTVRRPISLAELRALLAVQPKADKFDEKRLIPNADSTVLAVCGGLVQYRGQDKRIYFTHFTVTEYLLQYILQEDIFQEILACYDLRELKSHDSLAAAVCLRYLCYDFVGALKTPQNFKETLKLVQQQDSRFTLLSYAVHNWFIHLGAIESIENSTSQLALRLLDQASPNLGIWWHMFWFSGPESLESTICPTNFSGLHVVAYLGLTNLIPGLLPAHTQSCLDSARRSPLWWAVSRGHAETTRLLVKAGFDPDTPDQFSIAAAHRAAAIGDLNVFKILLSNAQSSGSMVKDSEGWTPLHWSVSRGHHLIVDEILRYRFKYRKYGNGSTQCRSGRTSFHLAALNGHDSLIRRLNIGNKERNLDIQDTYGLTALHLASARGYQNVVATLMRLGADLTIKDNTGKTASQKAKLMGNESICSLLELTAQFDEDRTIHNTEALKKIGENLNVYKMQPIGFSHSSMIANSSQQQHELNSRDKQDVFTLKNIINGHQTSLRILLDKGRQWAMVDERGRTSLHHCAALGYFSILRDIIELLEGGDEYDKCARQEFLNRQDDRGWSALHYAAAGQFPSICKRLLSSHASAQLTNSDNLAAYHLAIKEGHQMTIETIARCARLPSDQIAADFGFSALHIDARDGTLCEQRIEGTDMKDLQTVDNFGRTPLYRAVEMGRHKVVQLLANKLILNLEEALDLAILGEEAHGNKELIHVFIEKFVPGDLCPGTKWYRLGQHLFSRMLKRDDVKAVTALCKAGIDSTACKDFSDTSVPELPASVIAIQEKCTRVALFLIEQGADVSAVDHWGRSSLQLATENLLLSVVECLLQHGADPNQVSNGGGTPLQIAFDFNTYWEFPEESLQIAKLLLEHGASFIPSSSKVSPAWTAIDTCKLCSQQEPPDPYSGILDLLKAYGHSALMQLPDKKGFTPIHVAAAANDLDTLQDELDAGVPSDWLTFTHHEQSPLQIAIENDSLEAARLLLEHGADISRILDQSLKKRYDEAESDVADRRVEMVKMLLEETRIY